MKSHKIRCYSKKLITSYVLTSERRRLRAPTSAGTQLAIVILNKPQYVGA